MTERAEEVCRSSADHTHEEDFFLTNSKRQPPHDTSAGQIGTVLTVCVLAHRCTLGPRVWQVRHCMETSLAWLPHILLWEAGTLNVVNVYAFSKGKSQMVFSFQGTLSIQWLLGAFPNFLKPGGTVSEESVCQCRSPRKHGFGPWVWEIPWNRKWQPTPVFLLGKFMDRGAWRTTVHLVTESVNDWAPLESLIFLLSYF